MKFLVALLVVVSVTFAGCSDSGDKDPIVISSSDPIVASSNVVPPDPEPKPKPAKGSGEGHIAGYVVDEAFNIQPDVVVRLPAFSLNDVTDRNGEFSFVDLPAGVYLLKINHTGFKPVQAMLQVQSDEFTRVQVVLKRYPPPQPYHDTYKFEGYAAWTTPGAAVLTPCSCTWEINAESRGLHTIIIEAFHPDGSMAGDGFEYVLRDQHCCARYAEGSGESPLRVELKVNGTRAAVGHYDLSVVPFTETVGASVSFEAFATLFYNSPPPDGWSIADGSS